MNWGAMTHPWWLLSSWYVDGSKNTHEWVVLFPSCTNLDANLGKNIWVPSQFIINHLVLVEMLQKDQNQMQEPSTSTTLCFVLTLCPHFTPSRLQVYFRYPSPAASDGDQRSVSHQLVQCVYKKTSYPSPIQVYHPFWFDVMWSCWLTQKC